MVDDPAERRNEPVRQRQPEWNDLESEKDRDKKKGRTAQPGHPPSSVD